MTTLDAKIQRSTPVSEQIRDILRERLRSGYYSNNGRFPSEESLSVEFSASRATIRTALAALVGEGLLFRNRGIGTFVASHNDRLEGGLERLESVLAMAERQNLKTHVANLTVETVEAKGLLLERLKVAECTRVTCVRRTIMVGSKPVSYLVDFVPEKWLTPADVDKSFTGSVLDLLIQRYTRSIRTAIADVTAVSTNRRLSGLLKVSLRSPLLLLSETVFNEDGTVVAYSDNYFVPGQFCFRVIRR